MEKPIKNTNEEKVKDEQVKIKTTPDEVPKTPEEKKTATIRPANNRAKRFY